MTFSRVVRVVAFRLDFACFVSVRRPWLVWFDFVLPLMDLLLLLSSCLALAVFCFAFLFCLFFVFLLVLPPCSALALAMRGAAFSLCMSFEVACASARLVRLALSFCCGDCFLLLVASFCDSALRVTPAETRLMAYRRRQVEHTSGNVL